VEAPAAPMPPPPPPPPPAYSTRSSSWFGWLWGENLSRSSYSLSDKSGRRLSVLTSGTIELTDDDGDVKQIEAGGYFKVEERSGGLRRRVEIRSDGSRLDRRWLKNGAEADYDAEASQWLSRTLKELGERTGLGAEKRITRILSQRGPSGLLDAATRIQSDYVKRLYLNGVISSPALDTPTMTRVLDEAATLSSSYERCEVLRAVAARGIMTDDGRLAYVRATSTMSSDYERKRALHALLKTPLSSPVLTALLLSASKISSDYELTEVLTRVSETQTFDATSSAQFVAATRTIHSDYEHRRALMEIARRPALSADLQQTVLSSATTIGSDYEAAELLCALSHATPIAEAARPAFFAVVDTLQSDYERGRALKAYISGGGKLADASVRSVIASTTAMRSDFEAANVLLQLSSTQALAGDSRQEFVRATERMSSQHERERTLVSLLRQETTPPR
jgi:hypothetical protein